MTSLLPTVRVRVSAREEVAAGIVALTLAGVDGPLPPWEPGAHIDLLVAPGIERQYSLCGVPGAPTWRIAVLREPASRGGSAYVHASLAVGAELQARMPRNHFAFSPGPEPVLFVAGGIGITPLLPMIAAAAAAGTQWRLAYAGRTRASMAFLDEVLSAHPDRVRVYADGDRLPLPALLAEHPDAVVYGCGPERMIEELEALAGSRLHVERFAPKPVEAAADTEFEVEAGGVTVTVPPDRSILEVLEDAGLLVLSSCREGTCGTCEVPVLEGEPDHRDSVLAPDEQHAMMICVSRSRSPRLVLDV